MKNRFITKALCLFLLFILLLPAAQAAPFEINPLDPDMSNLVYTYWLVGPEKALMMPVRTGVDIIEDREDLSILLITHADFDEVYFAFFAIENPDLASKDLDEYSDEDMPEALSAISSQPEALRVERYGEIAPGVTAVWADEDSEGTTAKHLVVFYQGWVYNAMAQTMGGQTIPQAAMDVQQRLMESMLMAGGSYQSTWTAGGLTLTAPEPFLLCQPEAGNEDFRFVYIFPEETGPLLSLCTVYAIGTDMPATAGLAELSIPERKALLASAPLRMEEGIAPEDVEGQPGIMRYTAEGEEIYAALHKGLLLLAVNMPRDDSQQWEGDFRLAALNTMLGREATWPVRVLPEGAVRKEGSMLLIPSGKSLLKLSIPDGYGEYIVMDDGEGKILGLESPDGPLFILRVMPVGAPFAPYLAESAGDREQVFDALSANLISIAQGDVPEAKLKAEFLTQSLLTQPGGRILDEEAGYLMMFCALDNSLIILSAQSETGRLPEGIQDALLALLTAQP